jgi:hypothetical protein
MQTLLKAPGVGKKKVKEVDIDGELVSKVSKAGLLGGGVQYYPGEVQQSAMNMDFHNEIDEFLMDQEDENPPPDIDINSKEITKLFNVESKEPSQQAA